MKNFDDNKKFHRFSFYLKYASFGIFSKNYKKKIEIFKHLNK